MSSLLFFIFIAGISVPTLAHEPDKDRAKKIDFSEMKKTRLERLDKMRACISKSSNFEEIRACKPKRKN